MIETYIKPAYQRLFVNAFINNSLTQKFSPNALTLVSFVSGVCVFPALYFNHVILATILLLLSGYFDTVDGALARATNQASLGGTVYDIMSDRMVECAVVLGLCSMDPGGRGMLALLMLASMLICITSFLVVGIFAPNQSEKSFHYSPGLMERPEAFMFFIAMMWLPQYFTLLAGVFAVLVLFTGLNRIREFSVAHKQNN